MGVGSKRTAERWGARVGSLSVGALMLGVSACASQTANLPRGEAAYALIPAVDSSVAPTEYRFGPLDTVDLLVFQEPDLSVKGLQVDSTGQITVPLIGEVKAAGKTGRELSTEIAAGLSRKYLQDPQVSVTLVSSVSQKITVQGSVTESGVYTIKGRTSLLEAIAMAKGATRNADLNEVVVFRDINGQRNAAVFDVASIQRGDAPDPTLQGNDVVIVGLSTLKSAWRDILSAAPFVAIFRPFY